MEDCYDARLFHSVPVWPDEIRMTGSGKIILVRHGSTKCAAEGRFCGVSDIPLDPDGIRQAETVAKDLIPEKPSAIFSSPLKRAHSTALATAALTGLPVKVMESLAEADFGDWENLAPDEIERMFPESYSSLKSGGMDFTFPNGERLRDFCARVESASAEIINRADGGCVAVFTHGGVIRYMLCHMLGLEYSKYSAFYVPPGGRAVVETHNGKGVLTALVGNGKWES